MVRNLLDGLREMHNKKIMHRDLKPENILFRGKTGYDCVIGDYGLAEFSNLDDYLFVRCGTPGYVAPEVINIRDSLSRRRSGASNPSSVRFGCGTNTHPNVTGLVGHWRRYLRAATSASNLDRRGRRQISFR